MSDPKRGNGGGDPTGGPEIKKARRKPPAPPADPFDDKTDPTAKTLDVAKAEAAAKLEKESGTEKDPKYKDALEYVLTHEEVSISLLQRALGVGYNHAAKFIETFEAKGYVSESKGSGKPRKALLMRDGDGDIVIRTEPAKSAGPTEAGPTGHEPHATTGPTASAGGEAGGEGNGGDEEETIRAIEVLITETNEILDSHERVLDAVIKGQQTLDEYFVAVVNIETATDFNFGKLGGIDANRIDDIAKLRRKVLSPTNKRYRNALVETINKLRHRAEAIRRYFEDAKEYSWKLQSIFKKIGTTRDKFVVDTIFANELNPICTQMRADRFKHLSDLAANKWREVVPPVPDVVGGSGEGGGKPPGGEGGGENGGDDESEAVRAIEELIVETEKILDVHATAVGVIYAQQSFYDFNKAVKDADTSSTLDFGLSGIGGAKVNEIHRAVFNLKSKKNEQFKINSMAKVAELRGRENSISQDFYNANNFVRRLEQIFTKLEYEQNRDQFDSIHDNELNPLLEEMDAYPSVMVKHLLKLAEAKYDEVDAAFAEAPRKDGGVLGITGPTAGKPEVLNPGDEDVSDLIDIEGFQKTEGMVPPGTPLPDASGAVINVTGTAEPLTRSQQIANMVVEAKRGGLKLDPDEARDMILSVKRTIEALGATNPETNMELESFFNDPEIARMGMFAEIRETVGDQRLYTTMNVFAKYLKGAMGEADFQKLMDTKFYDVVSRQVEKTGTSQGMPFRSVEESSVQVTRNDPEYTRMMAGFVIMNGLALLLIELQREGNLENLDYDVISGKTVSMRGATVEGDGGHKEYQDGKPVDFKIAENRKLLKGLSNELKVSTLLSMYEWVVQELGDPNDREHSLLGQFQTAMERKFVEALDGSVFSDDVKDVHILLKIFRGNKPFMVDEITKEGFVSFEKTKAAPAPNHGRIKGFCADVIHFINGEIGSHEKPLVHEGGGMKAFVPANKGIFKAVRNFVEMLKRFEPGYRAEQSSANTKRRKIENRVVLNLAKAGIDLYDLVEDLHLHDEIVKFEKEKMQSSRADDGKDKRSKIEKKVFWARRGKEVLDDHTIDARIKKTANATVSASKDKAEEEFKEHGVSWDPHVKAHGDKHSLGDKAQEGVMKARARIADTMSKVVTNFFERFGIEPKAQYKFKHLPFFVGDIIKGIPGIGKKIGEWNLPFSTFKPVTPEISKADAEILAGDLLVLGAVTDDLYKIISAWDSDRRGKLPKQGDVYFELDPVERAKMTDELNDNVGAEKKGEKSMLRDVIEWYDKKRNGAERNPEFLKELHSKGKLDFKTLADLMDLTSDRINKIVEGFEARIQEEIHTRKLWSVKNVTGVVGNTLFAWKFIGEGSYFGHLKGLGGMVTEKVAGAASFLPLVGEYAGSAASWGGGLKEASSAASAGTSFYQTFQTLAFANVAELLAMGASGVFLRNHNLFAKGFGAALKIAEWTLNAIDGSSYVESGVRVGMRNAARATINHCKEGMNFIKVEKNENRMYKEEEMKQEYDRVINNPEADET